MCLIGRPSRQEAAEGNLKSCSGRRGMGFHIRWGELINGTGYTEVEISNLSAYEGLII